MSKKKNLEQGSQQSAKTHNTIETTVDSSNFLVRFDLKSKIYLGLLLGLFILFVYLKFHGSSVSMWNQLLPGPGINSKTGIVTGTPKSIRSDDWLAYVTFFMSQAMNGYPTDNTTIGSNNSIMLTSVPHHFISTYLRPMFWGAYFLDVERAFAWQWSYRIFFTIAASFLFFMLITGNKFWISVFGSLWVFLTPPTQWWSLYPGNMFGEICGIFVAMIYLLYSRAVWQAGIATLALVFCAMSFLGEFYPAYMIPFTYFLLISLSFFIARNFDLVRIRQNILYKLMFAVAGLALFSIATYLLLDILKPATEIMMNTAYPGKRFAKGGDFTLHFLFSCFLNYWVNESRLPSQWGNICEFSSSLLFFPVVLYFVIRNVVLQQKPDIFITSICVLILMMCSFMIFGFADIAASVTLFYFSPASRMLVPLGYINVALLIIFIANFDKFVYRLTIIEALIIAAVFAIFVFVMLQMVNNDVSDFFKTNELLISALFAGVVTLLVTIPKFLPGKIAALVLILFFVYPSIKANPLAKGLPSILKNPLYTTIQETVKADPESKWIVFGSFTVSNFVKIAGAKCVSGLTPIPDFEKMKAFDPEKKYTNVYNRYGFMNVAAFIYNDSCIVRLEQPDLYTIGVDPCSPRLQKLGVKYVVFTYQPQPAEVRCLALVYQGSVLIYKVVSN